MNVFIQNDSMNIMNTEYYGEDSISGIISDNTGKIIPNSEVKIFNQISNSYIYSIFSNEKGEYVANNIDFSKGRFFIVAHDSNRKFNGVIADNIGG